ncbi:MAG: hypothetical protein QXL86_02700 [Candidatus Aenigmatarchaeota archaeon]
MPRSLEKILRDLEYVRNIEDGLSIFLAANIALEAYNKIMYGESDAEEKIRVLTLEYLSKIAELRKSYEKERDELLKSTMAQETKG